MPSTRPQLRTSLTAEDHPRFDAPGLELMLEDAPVAHSVRCLASTEGGASPSPHLARPGRLVA